MKVVQINSVCGRGSTGKICVAVSQLMTKAGIENYILYSRWHSDYRCAIKYENDRYAKYQALREKVLGTYGFEARKPTKKLISYLEQIQPDIVHLHVLHSHDVNLTLLFEYLRRKSIKVFWTFHDCWAMTGYCPMFDMIGCEKWRTSCHQCPEKTRFSWFFDRSKEMHDRKKKMVEGVDLTIITPSEWLAGIVKQSFLNQFPIKVIHNGIDLDVFKPFTILDTAYTSIRKKYGLENKKVLLGVADVWSEHKGFSDYIKLAGEMEEEFQVVMIGLTDDQIKTLPNSVIGVQRTLDQSELAVWYSIASVVLNLSYEETFGLTTVEGFACGTPCIAYNRTASNEFADNNTCIVVEAGNIREIHNAIHKLINSESDEVSKACRERALINYDRKHVFAKYLEQYNMAWGGVEI